MRRLLQAILGPLRPYIDHRVDSQARERLDQFTRQLEETRRASVETQRIVSDDLDATTEATAILGDSLRAIREELASLRVELEDLKVSLGANADAPAQGRRRRA